MTRALSFLLLLVFLAAPAAPQQGTPEEGQLDASETVFTVMAAMNAAGYDADLDSPSNHPLRQQVRNYIAARKPACLADLKRFFETHKQKDWTAELGQYVSFSLLVKGPPMFEYRWLTYELPPDVAPLEGLGPLMARFYSEAGIGELWQRAQPAFDEAIARYHNPTTRTLMELNGYLRNPTSGYMGRRFQIYVDLLGAPNQIQTRSYKDDYFVVVTPSPEPQIEDIRYSYLHYLLDPLASKYAALLDKKKALGDYALAAPFLEEYYKRDFLLLATTSLIKAIESRLVSGGAAKKQALVGEALGQGFILTPHFAEQLPVYEKQEQAMRLYFPELIESIDLKREEQRLERIEFATVRPMRKAKLVPAERKAEPTGPYKTLEEAEQLYSDRALDKAREAYLRLLQQTEEKSLHAKSYYGLARIAALQKDPELSEKLFQKTLELSPDPQVRGWTLVYLGRLADVAGQRGQAAAYYRAALAVEGASAAARKAAEKGARESFHSEK